MHGAADRKLPAEQASWLLDHVMARVTAEIESEDVKVEEARLDAAGIEIELLRVLGDDCDARDDGAIKDDEAAFELFEEVTVGRLRSQLRFIEQESGLIGLIDSVLKDGEEAARRAEDRARVIEEEAHRFIAVHQIPPENTLSTINMYLWHSTCLIQRYENSLRTLQTERRTGTVLPSPSMQVDVNLLSTHD
jgi:hypothetical protein